MLIVNIKIMNNPAIPYFRYLLKLEGSLTADARYIAPIAVKGANICADADNDLCRKVAFPIKSRCNTRYNPISHASMNRSFSSLLHKRNAIPINKNGNVHNPFISLNEK